MKAQRLTHPAPVDSNPLSLAEIEPPRPGPGEVRLRVHACGLCHTDLHIIEGELRLPRLPLTPGHQIVGVVDEVGNAVTRFRVGERLGVPWLYGTCGKCEYCTSGRENLCDNASFTGYHADGGYAEQMIVHEDFAYPIPKQFSDTQAAPLLCAGVIGYRALRLSGIRPGQRLGMYGFGASAHIALQIARHQRCEVFVFTRSKQHQDTCRGARRRMDRKGGGHASSSRRRIRHFRPCRTTCSACAPCAEERRDRRARRHPHEPPSGNGICPAV